MFGLISKFTQTLKTERRMTAQGPPADGEGGMMLPDKLKRNESEITAIRQIAEGGQDRPVLMLNLNRYTQAANYPGGEPYRGYIAGLTALVESLGGKILWRLPVFGQPVGTQERIDEILAIWYPAHQAYLDVPGAPGGEENYRLRRLCVESAQIQRCAGEPLAVVPADADSA
jgi:hypothetical protein